MKDASYFLASTLLAFFCFASVNAATGESGINEWQMRRLMQPGQSELQREQQGHIMIYHGLTDKVVGNAMDKHFNRIDSMMFTGTVVTDASGEPMRDPETGDVLSDDDGCD